MWCILCRPSSALVPVCSSHLLLRHKPHTSILFLLLVGQECGKGSAVQFSASCGLGWMQLVVRPGSGTGVLFLMASLSRMWHPIRVAWVHHSLEVSRQSPFLPSGWPPRVRKQTVPVSLKVGLDLARCRSRQSLLIKAVTGQLGCSPGSGTLLLVYKGHTSPGRRCRWPCVGRRALTQW